MLYNNSSYLKLIIGPMFSSKTSYLLSEINKYKYITDDILVINHVYDKQRHPELINGFLKSHDAKEYFAIMVNLLQDILNDSNLHSKYEKSKIILIDEAQFYPDLYIFIKNELQYTKKIFIVAGLNCDINQNPFGDIHKLLPICDDIIKLSAFCMICKDSTLASFTKLKKEKTMNSNLLLIGAEESYIPVCRHCYYNY